MIRNRIQDPYEGLPRAWLERERRGLRMEKLKETLGRIMTAIEANQEAKEDLEIRSGTRRGFSRSLEEGSKGQDSETTGVVVEFPSQWSEEDRAIPNAIARSALFAPIRRGRRPLYNEALIASRGDVEIRYTGDQLDMADQDVWLLLIEIARRLPIGSQIAVSRYGILKALRKNTGKSDHDWLLGSIKRLVKSTVWIKARRYQAALHLVDSFELDEKTGKYSMRLNPELVKLYDKNEYALIDWERRQALKRHVDLAKWLQAYIATHQRGEEHRIGIRLLKEWSGAKSALRHFRQDLRSALSELERLGEIENPRIEADVVVWKRQ